MVMAIQVNSTIFTGKGGVKCAQALPPRRADPGPATGTVDAQAPVFTRVPVRVIPYVHSGVRISYIHFRFA